MIKYLKNEDTVEHTYQGTPIAAGAYYLIPSDEHAEWAADEDLLADIALGLIVVARSDDGTTDMGISDGIDWLKGVDQTPRDSDGSPITRPKHTKSGWHYEPRSIDFFTAEYKSLYNRKHDGNIISAGTDYGDASLKFYDDQGAELSYQQTGHESETEQQFQTRLDNDCVMSVMDWQPTYDMDIIGGYLMVCDAPTTSTYLWTIVAPEVPEVMGGQVPHVAGGWNLRFFNANDRIQVDGRGIKTMAYDPVYNSNKFRTIVKHSAGQKIGLQIVFEHFKA